MLSVVRRHCSIEASQGALQKMKLILLLRTPTHSREAKVVL